MSWFENFYSRFLPIVGLSQGSVLPARCGAQEPQRAFFSLYIIMCVRSLSLYMSVFVRSLYICVCVRSLSLSLYMCVCALSLSLYTCVCMCGSRVKLDRVLVCSRCYVMIHVQSTLCMILPVYIMMHAVR